MKGRTASSLLVVSLAAATASAQPEALFVEFDPPWLEEYGTTTVTLWAQFSSDDYAFHMVVLDIEGGPSSGARFTNPEPVLQGPGSRPGETDGMSVTGIVIDQLSFPPAMIYPDPSNPIALWRAELTAGSVSTIVACTRTSEFSVYPIKSSGLSESRASAEVRFGLRLHGSLYIDYLCYADCDCDTQLTLFDFLCFQTAFTTGATYSDCDEDGALTFFDFLCFQNEFAAGCLR